MLFEVLDYKGARNARIEKFDLSSHADREELVTFAADCAPRTIILTHGDPESRSWFTEALREASPETRVIDPTPLREYALM